MSDQNATGSARRETRSLPFAISVLLLIGGVLLFAIGAPLQGLVAVLLAVAIMVIRMAVRLIDRR